MIMNKPDETGGNLEISSVYGRTSKMASISVNIGRWPIVDRYVNFLLFEYINH